jgi:hypothetical protein
MASWSRVEVEAPELTAEAHHLFDAHVHKTLATIRGDGSPRISGTEIQFRDGDLYIGSMWLARKALDLRVDPRFALHSGSGDPPGWSSDAKIAGTMEEILDPTRVEELNGPAAGGTPSHLFRAHITELVVVRLGEPADHLVIESWHEGRGLSRARR